MSDEIQVINQETLPLSEMTPTETEHDKGKEVSPDKAQEAKEEFSLDGYQVVRGEFFAHLFEPSVTFNDEKVAVNVACLRKLPEVEYVQFLVNPGEKKLAVKPCTEDTKDSFRWASGDEPGKRKPKHITCRIFYAKVLNLMGWSPDYRYKILGKLIRTATDQIFVFDLSCAETYKKKGGDRALHQFLRPEGNHRGLLHRQGIQAHLRRQLHLRRGRRGGMARHRGGLHGQDPVPLQDPEGHLLLPRRETGQ